MKHMVDKIKCPFGDIFSCWPGPLLLYTNSAVEGASYPCHTRHHMVVIVCVYLRCYDQKYGLVND